MFNELTENIKCSVSFYSAPKRTAPEKSKRFRFRSLNLSLNLSLNSITTKSFAKTFVRENVSIKTLVKLTPNTSREPPKKKKNLSNWHCLFPFSFQKSESRDNDDPSLGPSCDAIPTVSAR